MEQWFIDLPDPADPLGPWVNVYSDAGPLSRGVALARQEYGADEDGEIEVVVEDTGLEPHVFRVVVPDWRTDDGVVELFSSESESEAKRWVENNLSGRDGWIGLVSVVDTDEPDKPDPSERKRWRPRGRPSL